MVRVLVRVLVWVRLRVFLLRVRASASTWRGACCLLFVVAVIVVVVAHRWYTYYYTDYYTNY